MNTQETTTTTLKEFNQQANEEMARISAKESADAAKRAAYYEKAAMQDRLQKVKEKSQTQYQTQKDKVQSKYNAEKEKVQNKYQTEKEKVSDALKNVAKTSLDYSAKAADFIADKIHKAQDSINN